VSKLQSLGDTSYVLIKKSFNSSYNIQTSFETEIGNMKAASE